MGEIMGENVYDNFNANIHTTTFINDNNDNNIQPEESKYSGDSFGSSEIGTDDDDNNNNNNGNNNSNNNSNNSANNNGNGKRRKKKKAGSNNIEIDDDIKLAVKIALQFLLKNQPFPVKREDLFSVINLYVPTCNTNLKRKSILKLLKKHVNDILALNLLILSTKTKTEYVLTQNITYKQHNDLLLSKLDHNIRGFLIFLVPFFKVFHNKIPLNYLLYEINNSGYKTLKTKEEILKILNTPTLFSNIKNNLTLNRELMDPLDYIIYAKKLSYIDFSNDQYDEHSLDGFYITPTIRFEYEINMEYYITELLNIPNKKFQLKDVYVLFEEKYFMNLNYDNL
ncbi:hypothetical protein MKS88_004585 [Plasmodium brasilianum]|uniref:Uncharacterized protein n=2 Tax=Plasmodium (Plasmodium) TaxID=418103 RepID=A0A1A8W707_PLAMA|nr:conserved Plasmodium protein, unknown function [Plasmodium malariae]KAI4836781.1 hypothetical protein MKS88_004585 [Plasmodium brasilianum]SBS88766.1 conserved Plasmodium protein, unknown function [Plasmodium malariae]SCO94074.1 conserved Plasmodium protein, unknown function [Plasmodium malariae]